MQRVLGKVVLGEDRRQQEGADRTPSLVDIDRGLRGRFQFGQRRRRGKPQHRIVDEACPDCISAWRQNTKPSFSKTGLLRQSMSVSIQQQPVFRIIR